MFWEPRTSGGAPHNYRGISPLWHTQRMQAWNAEMQRIAIADTLASHGGLTPAAPYCVLATFRTMFDSRGTACGSPNHGGLTPAALMNVRLCIADGALCSERTSCTRSGWREPAVGNTGMLAGEKRISATTLAHAAKSGWREPAVVSEPRLQKRNRDSPVTTTGRSLKRNAVASVLPNHGGLTPAAPYCVLATFHTMFDSRRAAFGSPTHGGLTLVAPGCAFASRRKMFDYRNTSSDQVLRNSPLHQNWGT
jgi:hypothetical protein